MTRQTDGETTDGRSMHTPAELQVAYGESSLGVVLVARSARGVAAVQLGDERESLLRELRRRFPRATVGEGDADADVLAERVVALVEAPARAAELRLDVR